jgi:hypothetical protein
LILTLSSADKSLFIIFQKDNEDIIISRFFLKTILALAQS